MSINGTTSPSGHDFVDWLSPMLVKELRQGLRTKAFMVTFILVQLTMATLMVMNLLESDPQALRGYDGSIVSVLGIVLVLIIPIRGLSGVTEEQKANTLELVQITELNAWRILLGKWLALSSQSVLLAIAVMPYLVLRYYIGGVNVVGSLLLLGAGVGVSINMIASCLMVSTWHKSLRSLVQLVMLLYGLAFFSMAITGFVMPSSGFAVLGGVLSSGSVGTTVFMIVLLGLWSGFCIAVGASRIATQAENYALAQRVIVLLAVAIAAGMTLFQNKAMGSVVSMAMLGIGLSLMEPTNLFPGAYASLATRGPWGRRLGWLLYPGWVPGLVFTALVVGIFAAVDLSAMKVGLRNGAVWWGLGFVAVVHPVVLMPRNASSQARGTVYVLTQGLGALLYWLAKLIGESEFRWMADYVYVATPTTAWIWWSKEVFDTVLADEGGLWPQALVSSALVIVVVLFMALRDRRVIVDMEAQAGGML
jgi:ABC-type transport system involved in multi-copper enzyme maturation permease subunit